jgi:ribosomal protein S12
LELIERIQIVPSIPITSEIETLEGPIVITKRRRVIIRGVDYKKLAGIRTNVARSLTKGSLIKAKAKARDEDVIKISE